MIEMAQVESIRYLHHVEGKSQRQVAKILGISRHTVAKYLDQTKPPEYKQTKQRQASVLTPKYQAEIERMLEENKILPPKQRWIGNTMFLALQKMGYLGAEPTVRKYLTTLRKERRRPEAYVPLIYLPGQVAEFDWGEAEVILKGSSVKVQLFCYRLPYSHMPFVAAYPNQRQEAMFDGLRRAFEATGVPKKIKSDNLKQAVQKILEGKNRKEQDAYISFRTHYLVQSDFCNPGAGNEKGSVENLVGFAQRNIVGPRLEADSFAELNSILWQRCLTYAERTMRGETEPVLKRWQEEKATMRPLPKLPFDCCKILLVTASRTACVQFETCRYSVPVRFAGQELTLKAFWDRVEIYQGLKLLATHPRCYERGQDILDLDHYLDLLWQKPGALEQAKPFRMAQLPPIYHQFRAELNLKHIRGDREFIEILKLHREFPAQDVRAALEEALNLRAIDAQAVRQILVKPQFDKTASIPNLPTIPIRQPSLAQYDRLRKGGVLH